MSRQPGGRAILSFAIRKDGPADPGNGETIDITAFGGDRLCLAIRRDSRRPDGRGGRDMRIDLDRREALALGRHLIAEASGLAVVQDGEQSEVWVSVNLWNEDRRGPVMVQLTASSVGDEVLLSMSSLRQGAAGFGFDGDSRTLMDFDDARSFARALLAMTAG